MTCGMESKKKSQKQVGGRENPSHQLRRDKRQGDKVMGAKNTTKNSPIIANFPTYYVLQVIRLWIIGSCRFRS